LSGWEINVLGNVRRDGQLSLDAIAGFRYANLREELEIGQTSELLAGGTAGFEGSPVVAPATIGIFDSFSTRNEFYGGQLGVRGEYLFGDFVGRFRGTVALGGTHEVGSINGSTVLTTPATGTTTAAGGLLAVSSNSGRITQDRFSVVPELNFDLGYQ